MARQPRPASSNTKKMDASKTADNPFKALAALKGRTAPAGVDARMPKKAAPTPQPAAADVDADDLALFRRSQTGVVPLSKGDRAEIDQPRPPPVPRAKTPEAVPEPAPARRATDPLLSAYADVIPIADSGRVVLGQAPRRRVYTPEQPATTDKTDLPAGEMPPVILPPDADLSDPATLFRHAARGAQQIDDRNRVELPTLAPAPEPLKREADEREALNESLTAPLTFEDRLDMGDEAAFLRPGLPKRVLTDLRRGRWVLQGELDLHGLTRDEARDALAHFLAHSLQQGRRCIRVIHGKGLGSPGRVSILKQLSRGWLAQREEILAFCQAGPHDGGGGALLVLMRAPNGTRR